MPRLRCQVWLEAGTTPSNHSNDKNVLETKVKDGEKSDMSINNSLFQAV